MVNKKTCKCIRLQQLVYYVCIYLHTVSPSIREFNSTKLIVIQIAKNILKILFCTVENLSKKERNMENVIKEKLLLQRCLTSKIWTRKNTFTWQNSWEIRLVLCMTHSDRTVRSNITWYQFHKWSENIWSDVEPSRFGNVFTVSWYL